jgi:UDP-N-acetylmuramoyl-tripeptide--D-alanyl-D-alanine ligase
MFKQYIQKKLETYVRRYFEKHPEVKLVAVAGSIGKTSTKVAIATVLAEQYRVRLHEASNDNPSAVPLAVLGIEYPEKDNFFAWLKVFRAAKKRINNLADTDVIIQELNVQGPGSMATYSTYLQPDIAVITSVSTEHMDTFHAIEAVAQEELMVAQFSKSVVINRDDIDGRHASYLTNGNLTTYGTSGTAEHHFVTEDFDIKTGYKGLLVAPSLNQPLSVSIRVVGEHALRPAVAAATVGLTLGMNPASVATGLARLRPLPGRMNSLRGVQNTILIDDTNASSPLSASSALKTLYTLQAPQRIAVFGSMNDLGFDSQKEHEALGKLCDPNILSWVVAVGDEAGRYLAPAAKAQGCQVVSFSSAIEAGAFVHKVLEADAIILFSGSEADVYCEEALKVVLHSAEDETLLVRQSPQWLKLKDSFFSKFS